jgi:hypothetical protein
MADSERCSKEFDPQDFDKELEILDAIGHVGGVETLGIPLADEIDFLRCVLETWRKRGRPQDPAVIMVLVDQEARRWINDSAN